MRRHDRCGLLRPLSQSRMVEVARTACSIQIRIVGSVCLHSSVIQASQSGNFAADSDQLVGVDCIVAVYAAGDSKPHYSRGLDLVDDTIQIVAEHSSSQRLAPRLEEGDHTRDDRVESAEYSDEDPAAVTRAKACECGSEDNLGEEKSVSQGRCQGIDVGLIPTTLESACIQRLRMRDVRLAWRKSMRCDAHEIAELVVVVDGIAIGTLLIHVSGIVLE